eukprot:GHVN01038460.1.p1 GENE.GHVN01038460.1~~GHVN01038460.1.p1  ORF type:complete len:138 (-),score=20.52 GHVN01038460.1:777-1190(-)
MAGHGFLMDAALKTQDMKYIDPVVLAQPQEQPLSAESPSASLANIAADPRSQRARISLVQLKYETHSFFKLSLVSLVSLVSCLSCLFLVFLLRSQVSRIDIHQLRLPPPIAERQAAPTPVQATFDFVLGRMPRGSLI